MILQLSFPYKAVEIPLWRNKCCCSNASSALQTIKPQLECKWGHGMHLQGVKVPNTLWQTFILGRMRHIFFHFFFLSFMSLHQPAEISVRVRDYCLPVCHYSALIWSLLSLRLRVKLYAINLLRGSNSDSTRVCPSAVFTIHPPFSQDMATYFCVLIIFHHLNFVQLS